MRKEERDIFDDLIRSKLHDFESDPAPDDWESIARRLPGPEVIPLRKRWPYWAAAAVASLLVISSGIYFSQKQPAIDTRMSGQIEKETTVVPPSPVNEEPLWVAAAKQPVPVISIAEADMIPVTEEEIGLELELMSADTRPVILSDRQLPEQSFITTTTRQVSPIKQQEEKAPSSRKWAFGAGAGGFAQSSGNTVGTYALRSNSQQEDIKLLALNAVADQGKAPKTNVKHQTPVSFGLSVSRQLNNRFSIQTGLTYSMLTSDWETKAEIYNNKTRQRLHFIGIPLAVSYKIAEWERFRFYAIAGVQTEVNVAGKEQVKSYFEDQRINISSHSVRMKEWQWSVNARVGVSYPIVRFVSAFAEVGTAYYFDNGSDMETIYSDKRFNINPQFGIRFGF